MTGPGHLPSASPAWPHSSCAAFCHFARKVRKCALFLNNIIKLIHIPVLNFCQIVILQYSLLSRRDRVRTLDDIARLVSVQEGHTMYEDLQREAQRNADVGGGGEWHNKFELISNFFFLYRKPSRHPFVTSSRASSCVSHWSFAFGLWWHSSSPGQLLFSHTQRTCFWMPDWNRNPDFPFKKKSPYGNFAGKI